MRNKNENRTQFSYDQKRILEELVNAGATERENPRTPEDSYYSSSIGKKGEKTLELKI